MSHEVPLWVKIISGSSMSNLSWESVGSMHLMQKHPFYPYIANSCLPRKILEFQNTQLVYSFEVEESEN